MSLLDEIVSFILNIRRQEEEGISGRVKNRQKRAKSLTRGETLGAGNEEQGLGESLKVLEVEKIEKNKLKIDELLSPFIRDYPINCKHIKNVISKVAHDFYFQKFDHELLQMSLQVLMELLRSQRPLDGIPSSFFVMYGEDSGIKLINPNIKWPFSKGFYFYTIFFIEECIRDQMCLLTITVNGGSFEVFIDAKSNLEVRLFNVSKLVSLTRVSPRRWHYLKIGYCLNTGIIRNSYKLTVNFDGVTQERKDLPVPNISISDDITDIIIGRDFYGRINTAALSRCGGFEWYITNNTGTRNC